MWHLDELNIRISENRDKIVSWVGGKAEKEFIPLYSSVDVRVSGHKIAPVDTNIFPAGFNNLSQPFRDRASGLFKDYFLRKYPKVRKILIIPELHTRNPFYWENIFVLKSILEKVDYEVEVGIVSDDFSQDKASFLSQSGEEVVAYKVMKDGHSILTSRMSPDLLLINNDFSEKCPKTLKDIIQPVEPPVEIGWHTRRKSVHFEYYNKLASEVAGLIGIDPWIISIDTVSLEGIDFDSPGDRDKAASVADSMLEGLRKVYKDKGVSEEPYLFIKSNSGTYGMAVISVSSGDEIRGLNAEGRKRMRVSKGGKPVRDIVIQEGIPTVLKLESGAAAEPVFYLIEAKVAGGFLRLNKGKSDHENLNTKGMEFSPMKGEGDKAGAGEGSMIYSPAHELVSCIASIAAGYEIEEILREGGCKEESL
ncbi:MAG: glutamate--cysteine ligase [Thermodesulfobacteriota bacterium]